MKVLIMILALAVALFVTHSHALPQTVPEIVENRNSERPLPGAQALEIAVKRISEVRFLDNLESFKITAKRFDKSKWSFRFQKTPESPDFELTVFVDHSGKATMTK